MRIVQDREPKESCNRHCHMNHKRQNTPHVIRKRSTEILRLWAREKQQCCLGFLLAPTQNDIKDGHSDRKGRHVTAKDGPKLF